MVIGTEMEEVLLVVDDEGHSAVLKGGIPAARHLLEHDWSCRLRIMSSLVDDCADGSGKKGTSMSVRMFLGMETTGEGSVPQSAEHSGVSSVDHPHAGGDGVTTGTELDVIEDVDEVH